MGKLLHKLVHGIVPSWLTKIKSSSAAQPSLKQLLPFTKGSSNSPSSSTRNSQSLAHVADQEPSSGSCDNSDAVVAKPSAPQQEGTAMSTNPQPHKSNGSHHHPHHHKESGDTHHPPQASAHKDQHGHHHHHKESGDTHHPLPQTSTKKDQRDHHHPQQHHGNHNIDSQEREKRNQCMPEPQNPDNQGGRSGRHNGDVMEFCNSSNGEAVLCMQKENHHHKYAREHSFEAEISHDDYRKGYHDLLGLKRKSQYLLDDGEHDEEEDEGAEEEEEEGGSHRSGDSDMTAWGWKRRKGERGLMSCELPESICCIVGNGRAVVKESKEPHMAMWESMVEMIVGNGLWDNMGNLEFLLFCYLSLNEPHLHPLIQSSFLQVLRDLEKTKC